MYKLGKVFCAVLIAFMIFAAPAFSSDAVKVNVNTATAEELATLKGIGPAIAEKVIEYREQNGPFATTEDIKKVSGIGDQIFEDNKDMITVDAAVAKEGKKDKSEDEKAE
ncbi:MAG: helix-hairpin-helix domain-containing protein [Deltaproteobacteria bacterium]|nr:helix-hairpin-helix domain-containing protein [Deltaproteobacteria bacterium]